MSTTVATAIKVKAYKVEDLIFVVIRGHGFTRLEKAMIDGGEPRVSSRCARTSTASWPTATKP